MNESFNTFAAYTCGSGQNCDTGKTRNLHALRHTTCLFQMIWQDMAFGVH